MKNLFVHVKKQFFSRSSNDLKSFIFGIFFDGFSYLWMIQVFRPSFFFSEWHQFFNEIFRSFTKTMPISTLDCTLKRILKWRDLALILNLKVLINVDIGIKQSVLRVSKLYRYFSSIQWFVYKDTLYKKCWKSVVHRYCKSYAGYVTANLIIFTIINTVHFMIFTFIHTLNPIAI